MKQDYISLIDLGDEMRKSSIEGISFAYRGTLPSGKGVMLASQRLSLSHDERKALYLSALEASLSGFDIITIGMRGGLYSVLKGAEDGGGRLHLVSCERMDVLEKRRKERVIRTLLTGGSVISADDGSRARERAAEIAISFSSAIVTTELGTVAGNALDRGLECSILRSSLYMDDARHAACEGAPVVDTFSSFLAFPKCIAYQCDSGIYGFGRERFGILRL